MEKELCIHYGSTLYSNCHDGCCTGYNEECPAYEVSDVELVEEPHGESTGLERLFGGNGDK